MKLVLLLAQAFVEAALACPVNNPLEMLFGAWFRGPATTDIASRANQWAGRTLLASGSATAVISTSNVKSDSLIFLAMEGNANVASGQSRSIEVKTISEAGYFTIGTQDGVTIARNTQVMWEVRLPGKTTA